MTTITKLIEQSTVVLEACGARKKINKVKFVPMEGYVGDCAEVDSDDADDILAGEALTEEYLERVKNLKKGESIPDEEKRGTVINFRLAVKTDQKPKKVGV